MISDNQTVTLGDELDRLDREVDDLTAQLADADPGVSGTAMLKAEARDLNQAGAAVAALCEEYGPDATVTVRGITAGRYARVEDRAADMQAQKAGPGGTPGSSTNVYVAEGLVDAPFYDGGADDLDAKLGAISQQSVGVRTWLEDLISKHSEHDQGNWRPLAERLATATRED